MLKLGIISMLLGSIMWRTMPTNCREAQPHNNSNVNQLIASNIESFMDTTVQPCENFYQYACGHWSRQHFEQLDYDDTLGLLDYELNRKIEHLLRKLNSNVTISNWPLKFGVDNGTGATADNANTLDTGAREWYEQVEIPTIYRKVRTYYKSCKKVKPYNLKKYLHLIQPGYECGWYILSRNGGKNWDPNKFDWLTAIAKLRLYGLNGVLLKEEVLPRWDESSSNSIYLDKPNLGETAPMGEGFMIELLLDIGQTKRLANEIARKVNAFEAKIHKLQEIEDDEGPKEMQLGYLQQYIPQIDWVEYLKQLKGSSTTNMDTTVIIQNIPFMRSLVKMLNGVDRITLCNYIMLRFLKFLKFQGPVVITRQECIASLRRAMPLAMSHIVGRHFYRDPYITNKAVQRVFHNLKNKFHEIVSENRLQLQKPIVHTLLEKISAMRLQIGNAPHNATFEFYDEYYERVELDAQNFYVNQLSLLRLGVEKSHESLEYSVASDFTDTYNDTFILTNWLGSSSSPFYVKSKNLIIIPYGFLQMPVFHRHLRDVFKYSVLGFAIAHELMHGFDSNGIDYDSIGNIMGPSEEIAANQRFIHGLRCIQNELVTGSRTLNEKLADYEGFRLAFETFFYGNVTQGRSVHANLLPYLTKKQLFFISYAQFFCSKVHHSTRQSAFLEHALDELRVLQTLANYDEFSKEFGCERRTKMQSKNRCYLW